MDHEPCRKLSLQDCEIKHRETRRGRSSSTKKYQPFIHTVVAWRKTKNLEPEKDTLSSLKNYSTSKQINHETRETPCLTFSRYPKKFKEMTSIISNTHKDQTNLRFNTISRKSKIVGPEDTYKWLKKLNLSEEIHNFILFFWLQPHENRAPPLEIQKSITSQIPLLNLLFGKLKGNDSKNLIGSIFKNIEISLKKGETWNSSKNVKLKEGKFDAYLLSCFDKWKAEKRDLPPLQDKNLAKEQLLKDPFTSVSKKPEAELTMEFIKEDPDFREKVEVIVKSNFATLVKQQIGSRVIEELALTNSSFCDWLVIKFYKKKELWLESMSALLVLGSCLKTSKCIDEKGKLRSSFLSSKKNLFKNQNHKRAFVTFVESSDETELPLYFNHFEGEFELKKVLNDKYLTYIWIGFLKRGSQDAINLLVKSIELSFEVMAGTNFFNLLMNSFLTNSPPTAKHSVHLSICNLPQSQLAEAAKETGSSQEFAYFLFLVLASGPPETPNLFNFMAVLNNLDESLTTTISKSSTSK